jgi:hypothetical protein
MANVAFNKDDKVCLFKIRHSLFPFSVSQRCVQVVAVGSSIVSISTSQPVPPVSSLEFFPYPIFIFPANVSPSTTTVSLEDAITAEDAL